ncbi:hypothetical protein Tco_0755451 [Tanacetum coccineum]
MVKHDVEVESSGECVDEIDKLTKLSMKLINIGSMQFISSPKIFCNMIVDSQELVFQLVGLGNDVFALMSDNQLEWRPRSQFNFNSLMPSLLPSSEIKAKRSGPFANVARNILP